MVNLSWGNFELGSFRVGVITIWGIFELGNLQWLWNDKEDLEHLPSNHIRYLLVDILECIHHGPNKGKLFRYERRIQNQVIEQGQLGHDRRFEHLNNGFSFAAGFGGQEFWSGWYKPSGKATSDVSVTCICESASQSSLFDNRTKVVFNENSSATGSDTCWARIGNVKSTAALGLPKRTLASMVQKTDNSQN